MENIERNTFGNLVNENKLIEAGRTEEKIISVIR